MATVTARSLPWYAPPRVLLALREARRYPVVALSILTFLLVIPAVFASYVAPYDPLKGSLAKRLTPPVWQDGGSSAHLLGTDKLGRDILSRLIHGARVSLTVSAIAIFVGGIVGTAVGLISGLIKSCVGCCHWGSVENSVSHTPTREARSRNCA